MSEDTFITPSALLMHWQGHRRLTRRTIEVFPEDDLFTFSASPDLRSFGEMMGEVVVMVTPTVQGLMTGEWPRVKDWNSTSRTHLLAAWDEAERMLTERWKDIPASRFHDTDATTSIGLPPQPNADYILYQIDNEVHHRGQGFVYLRLLGIEPPYFFDR